MGASIDWERIWQEDIEKEPAAESTPKKEQIAADDMQPMSIQPQSEEESLERQRRERGYKALEVIQKINEETEQNTLIQQTGSDVDIDDIAEQLLDRLERVSAAME